ncbi:hypothetical protein MPC4_120024 [Methylocella tundrae]|uniref:Uncharacterized protein n=1 Tax=Methylocella tundrae TaxID=227605 RepID=A0A8B6M399_METTU|nr:hypothetical protein MPC4_120024 [Methylocella tundrae]
MTAGLEPAWAQLSARDSDVHPPNVLPRQRFIDRDRIAESLKLCKNRSRRSTAMIAEASGDCML